MDVQETVASTLKRFSTSVCVICNRLETEKLIIVIRLSRVIMLAR